MRSLSGPRFLLMTAAAFILADTVAQAQAPPSYFVVRGRIANGDQFDPGWPFNFSTATGGGSTSRAIPNTSGYGNQNYTGWGTMTVSAAIGAASLSATFQGNMDPVNTSRGCNLFYGCGWSPSADTQYSGIDVYVRGNPGTRYQAMQTDSGNLAVSVTKTSACQNNWANAQAHASWAGVNGSANATTENGPGGYCGVPVPKSGSAPVSLTFFKAGTSTTPTITHNGQIYSYAYSAQTVIGLSIYAEQDPSFTAHSGGSVTVNVAVQLVRDGQQPPAARITGPASAALNAMVTFDGSTSTDPDGTIAEYMWTVQTPTGPVVSYGPTLTRSWDTAGNYQVTLKVTDNEGLTNTASTMVRVGLCTFMIVPPSQIFDQPGTSQFSTLPTITVTASGSDCPWTATSNDSWITVANGPFPNGSGTVSYAVAPNFGNTIRAGSIAIADQTFRVTQRSCNFSLVPLSASFGVNGGDGSVRLNASANACYWTATSTAAWLTVKPPTSGNGSATIFYTAAINDGLQRRSASIRVAGQTLSVNQEGLAFAPTIDVSPRDLDFGRKAPSSGSFGSCAVSTGPKQMRLVVKNVGAVGSILHGSVGTVDPPFSVVVGGGAFSLAQGESRLVVLSFQPTAAAIYGSSLQITSDDPVIPVVSVPLTGQGSRYEKLSPLKGRFGQFYYCDKSFSDEIEIDPDWIDANICTINSGIPAITDSGQSSGNVRVHCAAVGNFSQAFAAIRNQGIVGAVQNYPGIWVPRYVSSQHVPTNLSNHSWGTAIDLNYVYGSINFPCYETSPPRPLSSGCGVPSTGNINLWNLSFKDAGFFWGVDYSNPIRSDPMHYEVIP